METVILWSRLHIHSLVLVTGPVHSYHFNSPGRIQPCNHIGARNLSYTLPSLSYQVLIYASYQWSEAFGSKMPCLSKGHNIGIELIRYIAANANLHALTLEVLKYNHINHGNQRCFFNLKSSWISNVSCFRFLWITMLWVYSRYKYLYSYSAGSTLDVRIWRLKSILKIGTEKSKIFIMSKG